MAAKTPLLVGAEVAEPSRPRESTDSEARPRAAVKALTDLRKKLAARGVNVTQEEIRAMRDAGRM